MVPILIKILAKQNVFFHCCIEYPGLLRGIAHSSMNLFDAFRNWQFTEDSHQKWRLKEPQWHQNKTKMTHVLANCVVIKKAQMKFCLVRYKSCTIGCKMNFHLLSFTKYINYAKNVSHLSSTHRPNNNMKLSLQEKKISSKYILFLSLKHT